MFQALLLRHSATRMSLFLLFITITRIPGSGGAVHYIELLSSWNTFSSFISFVHQNACGGIGEPCLFSPLPYRSVEASGGAIISFLASVSAYPCLYASSYAVEHSRIPVGFSRFTQSTCITHQPSTTDITFQ